MDTERKEGRHPTGLARVLSDEIAQGHYKIGDMLPTESELQTRFAATRYAVREALRAMKEAGLIVATPGVGTIVRASQPAHRYMQGFGTLPELIQLADTSRIHLLGHRSFVVAPGDEELLGLGVGQQWIEAEVLRYSAKEERPTCRVLAYLRPEHSAVVAQIDSMRSTIHGRIEQLYSVRIAEVHQRVVAISLSTRLGKQLSASAGSAALKVSRYFRDAQDRTVMLSIGIYPHDRYSHDTVFRVLQE
jgi:GntR family transcriptional regulator